MTRQLFCLLIVIFGGLQCANSANILFWFTGGTYSHEIPIWPLSVRLADRNHSITWITPYSKKPWEDPRIKIIVPPKIKEINTRYMSADKFNMRLNNQPMWTGAPLWSYDMCEYFLTMEESDKSENNVLWNNGEKFDLVVVDAVLCDCGHIIGAYHNAKVIISDSSPVMSWFHHVYGFPAESHWLPATFPQFKKYPMTFANLIENYLEPWYWSYIRRTQLYPKFDALIQKAFKGRDKIPSFLEMERKADLIFVNTHVSVELPRSLPPNVIKIGGLQMWAQRDAVVPESLVQFIDKAEQGAILLSFGSAIDFATIPKTLEAIFFEAFNRYPKIHFIAKASVSTNPENFPKNLRYEKWIPQKEILAHPKTLAFITHVGLNGVMEATYHGVPMIAVPIFAEQDFEAYHLEARETGIRLEIQKLTADDLSNAIGNITTDPKYRKNMKKLQAAFLDRPEGNPLDLAIKWTEYVIKHEDMSFMNPITYQPLTVYLEDLIFSPHAFTVAAVSAAVVIVIATAIALKLFGMMK